MKRPLTVTFDPDEVAKLPPQVQEALWRLARGTAPAEDPRTPNERLLQGIQRGESESSFVKRVAKTINPNGTVNVECDLKPNR